MNRKNGYARPRKDFPGAAADTEQHKAAHDAVKQENHQQKNRENRIQLSHILFTSFLRCAV